MSTCTVMPSLVTKLACVQCTTLFMVGVDLAFAAGIPFLRNGDRRQDLIAESADKLTQDSARAEPSAASQKTSSKRPPIPSKLADSK